MAQTTATDNQNFKIYDYRKIANRKIDLATADSILRMVKKTKTKTKKPVKAAKKK